MGSVDKQVQEDLREPPVVRRDRGYLAVLLDQPRSVFISVKTMLIATSITCIRLAGTQPILLDARKGPEPTGDVSDPAGNLQRVP
jgi:hypothetical protein